MLLLFILFYHSFYFLSDREGDCYVQDRFNIISYLQTELCLLYNQLQVHIANGILYFLATTVHLYFLGTECWISQHWHVVLRIQDLLGDPLPMLDI